MRNAQKSMPAAREKRGKVPHVEEVLAEQGSKDWQKENAMSTMEDYTQRFADGDFQAVFAVCDVMTSGAIVVCQSAGCRGCLPGLKEVYNHE